ncbi:uncharacterized protein PGTG_22427 [Puccinia graminis f. sp. tritici CRL 75-36-700-3]|uniref:Uncharacterized protein n=1 Tax=Puccinia graminis f. sp. tritici (strain CRL 75-36-700-3 / race SCCL) TaxID=418459 RepID=H6QUF1_PUCGT|nr:uncharacterized protein PGTG_22427 [Puccinia graminis f. sp. tritici CRL 75-36-700-3]EHS64620.1 hypothetical protein PGTG_22427 [Puccinia graminis f. sp. tritici CRL 75-36-700-3]
MKSSPVCSLNWPVLICRIIEIWALTLLANQLVQPVSVTLLSNPSDQGRECASTTIYQGADVCAGARSNVLPPECEKFEDVKYPTTREKEGNQERLSPSATTKAAHAEKFLETNSSPATKNS